MHHFVSKVLKKCALKQLDDHCKKYAPLPDYQSAYRQLHTCKPALVKLINDLLWNMENSEVTAFVTIDVLAAFNTVDHRIPFRCSPTSSWFDRHGKKMV